MPIFSSCPVVKIKPSRSLTGQREMLPLSDTHRRSDSCGWLSEGPTFTEPKQTETDAHSLIGPFVHVVLHGTQHPPTARACRCNRPRTVPPALRGSRQNRAALGQTSPALRGVRQAVRRGGRGAPQQPCVARETSSVRGQSLRSGHTRTHAGMHSTAHGQRMWDSPPGRGGEGGEGQNCPFIPPLFPLYSPFIPPLFPLYSPFIPPLLPLYYPFILHAPHGT